MLSLLPAPNQPPRRRARAISSGQVDFAADVSVGEWRIEGDGQVGDLGNGGGHVFAVWLPRARAIRLSEVGQGRAAVPGVGSGRIPLEDIVSGVGDFMDLFLW